MAWQNAFDLGECVVAYNDPNWGFQQPGDAKYPADVQITVSGGVVTVSGDNVRSWQRWVVVPAYALNGAAYRVRNVTSDFFDGGEALQAIYGPLDPGSSEPAGWTDMDPLALTPNPAELDTAGQTVEWFGIEFNTAGA